MAFDIPDGPVAVLARQAVPMSVDFDQIIQALQGNGTYSGCAVSAQASPDMTVAVGAGFVLVNNTIAVVTAGNVTVGAAHATNPRIDLICVNSSGTKSCVAGTAAASPLPPDIPSNSTVLARIDIPANATAINAVASADGKAKITDKRIFLPLAGVIAKDTGTVTWANTAAEQDLTNKTIPGGLMGVDKCLRITLWGDMMNNSGSGQTLTLKVYAGATVLYNDSFGSITANASRRSWWLQLVFNNHNAANSNFLAGIALLGTTGGATTGSGDLGAAGFREAVISSNGSTTIDTSADQAIKVTATLGAANSNLDIRVQGSTWELLG